MDAGALILAAGLMGLAGTPHCAAMCAAPCAGALRACGPGPSVQPAFQVGRVLGYATAGAVAASSMGALQQWLGAVPALRPLWTLLHLAALALGLWMLVRGRMPLWRTTLPAAPAALQPVHWKKLGAPVRGALLGGAWVAWPCALLQSALLLSLLANHAWEGAAAMAAFAIASSPGLVVGPMLLQRLSALRGGRAAGAAAEITWPVRLSGLAVAAGSVWALGHGLWERAAAYCATLL
ncbi:MAG: sulfite exporter TauE/SafE family protein [Pseudomonadota bacterium]